MVRSIILPLVLLSLVLSLVTAPPLHAQDPSWDYTGDLASSPEGRFDHTATLLNDGRVLVAGGTRVAAALGTAEVYDPAAGTWAATGALQTGRTHHTAVLLVDGRVLVAGGLDTDGQALASAEVYDPAAGTWAATGAMNQARADHAMVLLLDGSVLAVGGDAPGTAEVYNPNTGSWQLSGLTSTARRQATATVLRDGRVLLAGGLDAGNTALASTELMDPDTYAWAAGGGLVTARAGHAATLLPDGDLLVAGGTGAGGNLASAEVYDVDGGTWGATNNTLDVAVAGPAALLLADGTVLVAGGGTGRSGEQEAYRYDPDTRTFTATTPMLNGRIGHTLTLLQDGRVLAVGSAQDPEGEDEQAEVYAATLPPPPGPDPKKPTAGDPCLLRFSLVSMPAGPACGPYNFTIGDIDFFAFLEYFTDAGTVSTATEENLPDVVLNGTAGVTLSFDDFFLSAFRHLPRQIGDRRSYTGGVGEIRVNGDLKIRGVDGSLAVTILYPAPAGPGSAAVAVGYLRIDAAASDPDWVAAFDPNGTGMVRLDFVSFSSTGQVCPPATPCGACYGSYDVSICLRPLETRIDARRGLFANDAAADFDFSDLGVVMDFTNADFSDLSDAGEARVMVERIDDAPDGALPDGIDRVYEDHYWRFGTTAGAFTADVSFDLTDIPGVDVPANLRLLRREAQDDPWAVYADVQTAGNTLTAQNVDAFSEWALASTGGNILPVELASFTAVLDGADALLEWQTASETNNAGFEVMKRSNVECRMSNGCDGAWEAVGFVAGHGTTSEAQRYAYRAEGLAAGRHVFRLKQVDYDGTATYSPEVEVFADTPGAFVLEAAYPNPFNPTTALRFAVDAAMPVRLVVFDVLGRTVAVLYDGVAAPGTVHRVDLDAAHLPSGPYFYRLETPAGTRTRKMLLAK